jgi:hypothetical protein
MDDFVYRGPLHNFYIPNTLSALVSVQNEMILGAPKPAELFPDSVAGSYPAGAI